MTFISDQIIYAGLLVVGFFLGLVASTYILGHYHHCQLKCSVEGCLRDGTVRIWSDSIHKVIYVCNQDAPEKYRKSLLREALEKGAEHASGFHP